MAITDAPYSSVNSSTSRSIRRPPLERQRLRFVNTTLPYSEGFIEQAFVGPAELSNTWTNVVTTIPDRQLSPGGSDVLDGVVGDWSGSSGGETRVSARWWSTVSRSPLSPVPNSFAALFSPPDR